MNESKNDRTVNRKKEGKKKDRVQLDILDVLSKSLNPISTQEIAEALSKPWHSVQTRCLKLQIEGKINGFRVGRMNLWQEIRR
jgi:DNA-binding Lrp family transcriptional regulator